MCSGEKHEHYTNGAGIFVWHKNSFDDMQKQEEKMISNKNFNLTGSGSKGANRRAATCNGFY